MSRIIIGHDSAIPRPPTKYLLVPRKSIEDGDEKDDFSFGGDTKVWTVYTL